MLDMQHIKKNERQVAKNGILICCNCSSFFFQPGEQKRESICRDAISIPLAINGFVSIPKVALDYTESQEKLAVGSCL